MDQFRSLPNIDFEQVFESQTVTEFDERFLIKVHQYTKIEDYYNDASSKNVLQSISIPGTQN